MAGGDPAPEAGIKKGGCGSEKLLLTYQIIIAWGNIYSRW